MKEKWKRAYESLVDVMMVHHRAFLQPAPSKDGIAASRRNTLRIAPYETVEPHVDSNCTASIAGNDASFSRGPTYVRYLAGDSTAAKRSPAMTRTNSPGRLVPTIKKDGTT